MKAERIPRRAVLLTAGGLVAGGAGGAGLAAVLSGTGAQAAASAGTGPRAPSPAQASPGEDLMNEHGLLVRILLIYRELDRRFAAGRPIMAEHPHDAALIIHDYIEGFHEQLEEAYVFPRLTGAGQLGPTVSTLLLQHARGREQTQLILAKTERAGVLGTGPAALVSKAMAAFVRMYEPHEAREDTVIFPAFRSLLSAAEAAELGERFASLEREQFAGSGFTAMLSRVAAIEQALGIYDLAQFTPPNITPPPIG
jgi:hemerythrin-like domain-containing protein